MHKKIILSEKYPDLETWSVGSVSSLDEKEILRTVVYEKNPPVIFNPKSSVKRLDVKIVSNRSKDQDLLHHLLQKTRQS